MKKRLALVLLISGIFMCQPVLTIASPITENTTYMSENSKMIDPRSQYIGDYGGNLTVIGSSTIEAFATLRASYTDKIEITAQFQRKSGSTWINYGSAITETDYTSSMTLQEDKNVPAGKYRVKFNYKAYVDDDVVETRNLTTNSVTIN